MKLVAFDGDDTLWTPLSLNLSDRTPTDAEGWPHYRYTRSANDPLIVERDDGALFALRPEAREVMERLRAHDVLVGIISYNHVGNVRRIIEAFGLTPLVDYIVAEWHSNKDKMLRKMLDMADANHVEPADAFLIDDDPYHIYVDQCRRMGAGFRCFGSDITDLREVPPLVEASPDDDRSVQSA
ncbi:MAG: HAD-IIIC family phosphatase [Chloroflexota bacterium]